MAHIHLLPRQVTCARRTVLQSRRDGSGDPSYVMIFPSGVIAERTGEPRRPEWVRVPEHPAHGGLYRPERATRLPRPILEQSSPRSTTMKPHAIPLVAGV